MNFSELYKLIKESPSIINQTEYSDASKRAAFVNSPVDKMKNSMKSQDIILFGDNFEIYENNLQGNWVKYFFLKDKEKMAMYSGMEMDDGIITLMVETKYKAYPGKSLMSEIYTQFLLNKYNFIISDSAMTEAGFNFWYNNFDKFHKLGYIIKVGILEMNMTEFIDHGEMKSKKDLKDFYSDMAGRYRFMITKRNSIDK